MNEKFLPIIFAVLFFIPLALILIWVLVFGLTLGVISRADSIVIGLTVIIIFFILTIFFQKKFAKIFEKKEN